MPPILHVDMDAFYAAVEVRADPRLAGRPVVVGGAGPRGVVASCSYEARAYGVRSAMSSAVARRLCPAAAFVPVRMDLYADYSRRIHAVFAAATPLVEGVALDEAYLDVAGAQRLLGPAPAIAATIRERVLAETGLAASVGVAATKLVAKLASEAAKPRASRSGPQPGRGVVVVEAGDELAFLHPHPAGALPGVGPATAARLGRLGVATVGDLAAAPLDALVRALGRANAEHLHALACGRDPRAVQPERELKSVGQEATYPADLYEPDELHREVVRLSDQVAARLRRAASAGRTVTLKVRLADFTTLTRSRTLGAPVDTAPALTRAAAALLDQVVALGRPGEVGVRLLGVAVSGLDRGAPRQLALLDADAADAEPGPGAPSPAWADASAAVDAVRRRFGEAAVGPAALADAGQPRRRPGAPS